MIADEREPAITTACIRLHRLVRQVAAARRDGEAQGGERCARSSRPQPRFIPDASSTIRRAGRGRDGSMRSRWRWCVGDATLHKGAENETADLLNQLAQLSNRVRSPDYASARPLYERALAIREKALGPEHPD